MVKKSPETVHGVECQDLGESSDSAMQEEIEQRQCKSACQHVSKSVSLADVKRQLKAGRRVGNCDKKVPTPCSPSTSDASETDRLQLPSGVWLCLQCGHQGCASHATQHFNTPRSDSHALAVHTDQWTAWCFTCRGPVSLSSNKKLHEAAQFVRKRQGTLQPSAGAQKEEKSPGIPQQSVTIKAKPASDRNGQVLPKVRGFINIGNSCYLNSVLQCVIQCHYLAHYLDLAGRAGRRVTLEDSDGAELQLELPEGGMLTAALCDLVKQMHTVDLSAPLGAGQIHRIISEKAAQFQGSEQQDAHELLRVLLEALRLEELRRHQRQIMRALDVRPKTKPELLKPTVRARLKHLGRQVSHTTVDSIFSGQLASLVVCQACMARTMRLEPFLDLSLPVTEDKPGRPRKLCSGGADDDDPAYVLSPKSTAATEGKSRHAQKKERRAARRTARGARGTARTEEPSPDSGNEPDQPHPSEHSSSDQGQGDADVEDNGDTELVIGSLLSGLEAPEEDAAVLARLTLETPAAGDATSQLTNGCVSPAPVLNGEAAPPSANGDSAAPPSANGDSAAPPSANGDSAAPPSANGDSAAPPSANGDSAAPPSANGDSAAPPSANGDSAAPPSGDSAAPPSANGDSAAPPSANGDSAAPPSANGESAAPAAADDERAAPAAADERAAAPVAGGDSGVSPVAPGDIGVESGDHLTTGLSEVVKELKLAGGCSPEPVDDSCGVENQSFCVPGEGAEGGGGGGAPSRYEWLSGALTTLATRYQAAAGECSVLTCLNQYTAPELLTGNNKFGCERCTQLQAGASDQNGDSEGDSPPPAVVYSNASKQLLIYSPPPVLTLQLKRFQACAFNLRKINRHVQFGETLDIAPFCSSICQDLPQVRRGQRQLLYSLFGVVEHSGRLHSGHYTAYVRVRRRDAQLTMNAALLTPQIADAYQLACRAAAEADAADQQQSDDNQPEPGRWFHASDTHVTEVTLEKVLKCQAYLLFYERVL